MPARDSDAAIAAIGFDEAVSVTDDPERCETWRASFRASAGWVGREDVQVPRGDSLRALCEAYGFPGIAVRHLVDNRHAWDDPRIHRLGAHVQWLTAARYTPQGYLALGWPTVFSRCPLFYAYAALGLSRRVAAEQAARGIDVEVTHATFRDIGQQVFLHHRVHRQIGMSKGWWLCHHLSHHLFRLGRLQFQRALARRELGPLAGGEPFLDVHVPEDGALDPASCGRAFEQAARFFTRHFPGEQRRFHMCASWLLDPALCELLPADSNILQFQRRFDVHEQREGPSSVFEFVFDRPDLDAMEAPDLSGLPRDTRLRTALIDHYAGGGLIRMGVGTAAL